MILEVSLFYIFFVNTKLYRNMISMNLNILYLEQAATLTSLWPKYVMHQINERLWYSLLAETVSKQKQTKTQKTQLTLEINITLK